MGAAGDEIGNARWTSMDLMGQLLKGSTDCLLLSSIKDRPSYGYVLIKEMEARSGGYFRFKEGTIYPALHRLEKEGLIVGKWERLENGQERRYYYITAKGEQALAARMAEWRGFADAVNLVIGAGS